MVVVLCPVRYYSAQAGLDPSWAVSLNQFQVDGVLFGRDVLLTYGPLAYLIFPMPWGSNLEQGIAFQLLLWAAFGATIGYLVARNRAGLTNLAIAAVCVPPGVRLIHEFGYAGPDFFLEFLVIFWLACAVQVEKKFYYLACVGAVLLAGIKLSTALGALSAILLLPILLALIRHRDALRFGLASWVGVPVVFAALFRVYSGSWWAVGRYLRSALDFSSGGGMALSLTGPATPVYAGLLILLGFAVLALALWWRGEKHLAAFAGALAGPLFLEFKHSFMRQDSHVGILFTFTPLLLLTVLCFVRFEFAGPSRRSAGPVLAGCAGLALILAPWFLIVGLQDYQAGTRLFPGRTVTDLFSFSSLKQRLIAESQAGLAPDRLSPDLMARLEGRTVTIYPWETAYAAANVMRHKPMPTFQAYLAYTPWLDALNAEFFAAGSRPDVVLFHWDAIDGRHPLLDCPSTFLAIYLNYELEHRFGPLLLLRKRTQPLAAKATQVKQQQTGWGESVHSPVQDRIALAQYLTLSGPGGHVFGVRVPPLVLDAPVPLNIVPMDLDDAENLFAGRPLRERFDTVALSGPGRRSFQSPLTATLLRLDLPSPPPGTETPPSMSLSPDKMERMMLERVNRQGVSDISARETLPVSGENGFVSVEGWAVWNSWQAAAPRASAITHSPSASTTLSNGFEPGARS